MRPIHSNVASVLGMSVTFAAVIYHPQATGLATGSNLIGRTYTLTNRLEAALARSRLRGHLGVNKAVGCVE